MASRRRAGSPAESRLAIGGPFSRPAQSQQNYRKRNEELEKWFSF
jgi:hypothetical protein